MFEQVECNLAHFLYWILSGFVSNTFWGQILAKSKLSKFPILLHCKACSFSRSVHSAHKWHKTYVCVCVHMCMLSCFSHVQLFATPWTVAHQAPLSMVFPRQEYWSGLPFPSPGDLPNPWIKPASLKSPALAGRFFTTRATWEGPKKHFCREKNKVIQKLKIFTYPLAVCIPMFIAALFTIAETWKQPKCPLMDD